MSLTTGPVRTHIRRQKVSFNVEDRENGADDGVNGRDNDPLPIVELKPFVQKVWRREKSFALPMDRGSSVPSVSEKAERSEQSMTSDNSRIRELDVVSEYEVVEGSLSPPPRTSYSLPVSFNSPRTFSFYVNEFEDFHSQKEHLNHLVGESDLKRKQRLHPIAQSKHKMVLEHSVSIIPGFITRDDRVKTTLTEITDHEPKIHRTFKPVTGEEFQRQQMLRVSGEPFRPGTKQPVECTPTPVSRSPNLWHTPAVRHGSPASLLYNTTRQIRESRVKRVKTPLYDHIDRSGVLPSLSIHATALKHRPRRNEDDDSEDYVDYREVYDPTLKHSIGGIENSLDILSKYGKPTKLERQLTMELENNLSRFRKSKDYSPFEVNPAEIAKYYPGVSPSFNMTQGEMYIQQAKQSNARLPSRKGISAKFGSRPTKYRQVPATGPTRTTTSTSSQISHLRQTFNEIEHIDTFDNLPQKLQNGTSFEQDRSDLTMSPGDEPSVPYDTPRSRVDSRFSYSVTEQNAKLHNEPVKELAQEMRKNDRKYRENAVRKEPIIIRGKTETSIQTSSQGAKTPRFLKEEKTPRTTKQQAGVRGKEGPRAIVHDKAGQNESAHGKEKRIEIAHCKEEHMEIAHGKEGQIDQEQDKTDEQHVNDPVMQAHDVTSLNSSPEKDIDASGRTFLTSDNIPQVAAVNG